MQDVHALALAHGGTCDGPPGLRPEYHAHYFGAYLRDPDGNKLCVACHGAGEMSDLGLVHGMGAKQRVRSVTNPSFGKSWSMGHYRNCDLGG